MTISVVLACFARGSVAVGFFNWEYCYEMACTQHGATLFEEQRLLFKFS